MSENRPYWMLRKNHFKEALAGSSRPLAMWVTVPWPSLIEILGSAHLDAAFIDMEHAAFGLDMLERMIVAADAAGVTPIVRPAELNPAEIGRILDSGAGGIIFAAMEDGASANLASRSLEYPPIGVRGWGGSHTRYAMWDGTTAVKALLETEVEKRGVYSRDYVEKSRADLVSIFIIESRKGVANVEEILDAGHPDAVSFGWGDYSVEAEFDLDECARAARVVYDACRSRGIGVSVSLGQGGNATEPYPGCYSVVGIDALLIGDALRTTVSTAAARV